MDSLFDIEEYANSKSSKRIRTRQCRMCNNEFGYQIRRGRDFDFCSDECRLKRQLELKKERYLKYHLCQAEGCTNKANRVGHGLCETCYYRYRRTGDITPKKRRYRYQTKHGYIKLHLPSHPLAEKDGLVAEHRKVLFEKVGPGIQSCFWCGIDLGWSEIVTDHLNERKDDNRPENLVVSCNKCNRARGATIPLVLRIKEESFPKFIEAMTNLRANRSAP